MTVHAEASVDIHATPAEVWKVLTDVEQMPTWTESVNKAARIGAGEFAVGAKVRLKQPRLATMVWEVTELEVETSFTWSASRGGVTTTAGHRLRAKEDGTTGVLLSIDQRGPMAGLVGLFTSKLTRKYLAMEAKGLKRRCES
ncbi:MAG: SRPBCC family protein [Acidimicrobiales bacterium]